jgi:hypothetical protein
LAVLLYNDSFVLLKLVSVGPREHKGGSLDNPLGGAHENINRRDTSLHVAIVREIRPIESVLLHRYGLFSRLHYYPRSMGCSANARAGRRLLQRRNHGQSNQSRKWPTICPCRHYRSSSNRNLKVGR